MRIILTTTMALCLATATWAQEAAPATPSDGAVAPVKPAFEPPNELKIVADFAKHISTAEFTDEQQKRVGALFVAAKDDKARRATLLADTLKLQHPQLGRALGLLLDEQTDKALAALGELAKSDDPYLAAHANFYAARALAMEERYEQALPMLEKLTGEQLDKTMYSGEAMFLKGVALAETLDRRNAIETLKDFAKHYPFASERMVIGALHLIDELSYLDEGTLGDVADRMDYSRRRLAIAESGARTQDEQTKIVTIIDKLIEEAEQQENQGGGGGGGSGGGPGGGGNPSGNQQPGGPASQSSAAPGQGRMGSLHKVARGSEDEAWGEARAREREEVLNAIKAKYPERYRVLIEEYYKSLQEDDR